MRNQPIISGSTTIKMAFEGMGFDPVSFKSEGRHAYVPEIYTISYRVSPRSKTAYLLKEGVVFHFASLLTKETLSSLSEIAGRSVTSSTLGDLCVDDLALFLFHSFLVQRNRVTPFGNLSVDFSALRYNSTGKILDSAPLTNQDLVHIGGNAFTIANIATFKTVAEARNGLSPVVVSLARMGNGQLDGLVMARVLDYETYLLLKDMHLDSFAGKVHNLDGIALREYKSGFTFSGILGLEVAALAKQNKIRIVRL